MNKHDSPSAEYHLTAAPLHALRAELARRQEEDDVARPECGSGSRRAHYNTSLHVAALFLILVLSTFACSFPIVVRRFPRLPVPHRFLFLSRHFGTGVLIATAFVHLLPTAFVSLTDPCLPSFWNQGYPAMAGLIAMISVLVVVGVEMFFATKGAGHVHGGELTQTEEEQDGLLHEMAPGGSGFGKPRAGTGTSHFRQTSMGIADYDSGGRGSSMEQLQQQNGSAEDRVARSSSGEDDDEVEDQEGADSLDGLDDPSPSSEQQHKFPGSSTTTNPTSSHGNGYAQLPMSSTATHAHRSRSHSHSQTLPTTRTLPPTDSATAARLLLQCLLLEAGILFHSIFIGMALSVSTGPPFLVLLIAISFHQTFEGLALGSRIAAIPLPSFTHPSSSPKPWLMALAYGATTPLGQAIGLGVHNLYDPESEAGLLMVGVMNSVSSGLLVFAGLVELLAEDFLREESYVSLRGRKRLEACGAVVAGALLMALVGAWA